MIFVYVSSMLNRRAHGPLQEACYQCTIKGLFAVEAQVLALRSGLSGMRWHVYPSVGRGWIKNGKRVWS